VFKTKRGADGKVLRYKARYIIKGYLQKEGVNYDETFASVVKSTTYRIVLIITAMLDLEVEQLDFITAFLNSNLTETIYITQLEGFIDLYQPVALWRLLKTLYGLKQSPREWYTTLTTLLKKLGFNPTVSDPCLFINLTSKIWILAYVDDLLIISKNIEEINRVKH